MDNLYIRESRANDARLLLVQIASAEIPSLTILLRLPSCKKVIADHLVEDRARFYAAVLQFF